MSKSSASSIPILALHKKYGDHYSIPAGLFFTDLGAMLDKVKPEAVATFTNTFDHAMVVEACARTNPGDDGEASGRQHGPRPRHPESRRAAAVFPSS